MVLEQVADSFWVRRQELHRLVSPHVMGQDQHGHLRELGPDRQAGLEALAGVSRRHLDVGDHDVRRLPAHGGR